MFSITLKRSVATLAIVAGLLAAAVPASARPQGAVNGDQGNDLLIDGFADRGNPPRATDELFGNCNFAAEPEGTQVGSEGVKDNLGPLETISFTVKGAAFRGEVTGLEPQ